MSELKLKKVFQPLFTIINAALAANPKVKLSDVVAELEEAAKARVGEGGSRSTTFHRDEETGQVVGIFDYYFKKWFSPKLVDVGTKAGTPSGYNSMSKVGLNQWTKQQREYKLAKDDLLTKVANGEIDQSQIAQHLEAIEAAKNTVIALPEGVVMFDTLEELQAHLPADTEATA
jgi:uncharacterized protein (DUF2267 family)